ncbi:ubiquinone biosynthesis hydrox, partial [Ramicandelaber brevisporus]
DVVVVGGGIVGAALTCSLAASNTTSQQRVVMVDAAPLARIRDWQPQPAPKYSNRTVSLTPASARYLANIGAWDQLYQDRVQPYSEMKVWDGAADGKLAFGHGDAMGYIVENQNVHAAILKALDSAKAQSSGGVDVVSETKVSSITSESTSSSSSTATAATAATVADSWPIVELSNGRRIQTRLLVGADGANSPVRTFANIESAGWDYNQHGLVACLEFDAESASLLPPTAFQRFLPSGPIALLPLPGNSVSMVWSMPPAMAQALKTISAEDFIALVNAAVFLPLADVAYLSRRATGEVHDDSISIADDVASRQHTINHSSRHLPPRIVGVDPSTRASFPIKLRNADTYAANRVALVGDAAHTVHPLAGQGLNIGLADAECLARVVADTIRVGGDIGARHNLVGYSRERFLPDLAMLGAVDKLWRLFGTDIAPVAWTRSLGMNVIDSLPFVKSAIVKYA